MAAQFATRQSFTVPASAGTYAPEVITFARANTSTAPVSLVGLTAIVESNAATGATLEVWLLKINGDPSASGDYFLSSLSLASGSATFPLASYPGVQLRAKSGGTSGAMVINASAD